MTIAAAKHYLNGKGAVRVHGGGFAGTVQAFVPVEMLADFKANMEKILGAGRCHVLSIRPEGGAVLLSLIHISRKSWSRIWVPSHTPVLWISRRTTSMRTLIS